MVAIKFTTASPSLFYILRAGRHWALIVWSNRVYSPDFIQLPRIQSWNMSLWGSIVLFSTTYNTFPGRSTLDRRSRSVAPPCRRQVFHRPGSTMASSGCVRQAPRGMRCYWC